MKIEWKKDIKFKDVAYSSLGWFVGMWIACFSVLCVTITVNTVYFSEYIGSELMREVLALFLGFMSFQGFWYVLLATVLVQLCLYLKVEGQYDCEVCGKRDYVSEMRIINTAQMKKDVDFPPKVVCIHHKKPYMKKVTNEW